ncbi:MAG: monovalent cation/H(+) antiporter subunit G [Propionibacteriaceae bacterium]|nr:monovalent cation/H(+) antiporter subunit G [Propionibacteriaceae bacterium]
MTIVLEVLAAIFVVVGSLLVLLSGVAMFRQRDAFARISVMSPATGMGLPLIVVAAFLHRCATTGFGWLDLGKTVLTVAALLVVSSVASNILARAAYLSGAAVHPVTDPQDLARAPEQPEDPERWR